MTATRTEPCACGASIVAELTFGVLTGRAIAAALDNHYATSTHQAWRASWAWSTEVPYRAEHVPTLSATDPETAGYTPNLDRIRGWSAVLGAGR